MASPYQDCYLFGWKWQIFLVFDENIARRINLPNVDKVIVVAKRHEFLVNLKTECLLNL